MIQLRYEGQSQLVDVVQWREEREEASPEWRAHMDEQAEHAELRTETGAPLPASVEARVRRRLRGSGLIGDEGAAETFSSQLVEHRREGGSRYLIPELWPWGTYPQLGGNPKAGKTSFVAELCAALLRPGYRLLDHFEPVAPIERDVVLINTEMDRGPVIDALAAAGLNEDDHLVLIHLREEGGARAFDLTNHDLYLSWVDRLVACDSCDGSDEYPPAVVIVDNLTAVLQDLNRPLEHYGTLHGLFVQLMQEVGCPNGLTVVHNTLAGGHAMGGTTGQNRPDGLWSYSSENPDDPRSKRWFKVVPRLGGVEVPRTQVLLEDGRLRLASAGESEQPEQIDRPEVDGHEVEVRARLEAAGAEGLLRTEVTGSGRYGAGRREALDRLIESGEVVTREEPGRGRRPTRCWLRSCSEARQ